MSPTGSDSYLAHFRARVLQDALTEATAGYWRRRAEQFENARPRRGDDTHRGAAPQLQTSALAEAHARCTAVAQACRHRADVAQVRAVLNPEVEHVLGHALDGCSPCLTIGEHVVDHLTSPTYARDLDAATQRLRDAIDTGDPAAIDQAAADVDQLDPTGAGTTPDPALVEPVPDLIHRHRRVITALDAHLETLESAA